MQMAFYSLQYTLSITCISGKFETITISTSFTILRVLYVDEKSTTREFEKYKNIVISRK